MDEALQLIASQVAIVALLIFAAFVIEAIVEYLAASWLKLVIKSAEWRAVALRWTAGAIGIFFCSIWGVDLMSAVVSAFGFEPLHTQTAFWFGIVMTGLMIGRGANWLHDLAKQWFGLDHNLPFVKQ